MVSLEGFQKQVAGLLPASAGQGSQITQENKCGDGFHRPGCRGVSNPRRRGSKQAIEYHQQAIEHQQQQERTQLTGAAVLDPGLRQQPVGRKQDNSRNEQRQETTELGGQRGIQFAALQEAFDLFRAELRKDVRRRLALGDPRRVDSKSSDEKQKCQRQAKWASSFSLSFPKPDEVYLPPRKSISSLPPSRSWMRSTTTSNAMGWLT